MFRKPHKSQTISSRQLSLWIRGGSMVTGRNKRRPWVCNLPLSFAFQSWWIPQNLANFCTEDTVVGHSTFYSILVFLGNSARFSISLLPACSSCIFLVMCCNISCRFYLQQTFGLLKSTASCSSLPHSVSPRDPWKNGNRIQTQGTNHVS